MGGKLDMTGKSLDDLARRHGIDLFRPTPDGPPVAISDETKRKILAALEISEDVDSQIPKSRGKAKKVSSQPCYLPAFLEDERVWGISLQLYELRSARNWGIGDFEDLSAMTEIVAALGGDFIGLNPLHAPFMADPDRCSPYEPSSRQLLNPLYIAVDAVPGFEHNRTIDAGSAVLRRSRLVDYVGVARLKIDTLRDIWERWRHAEADSLEAARKEFDTFIDARGEILRRHALFETLSFAMTAQGFGAGWHSWPEEYRDHRHPSVIAFAEKHEDEMRFHMWLQWLADRQLAAAAERAAKAGLRIGLYLDLAVGEAVDGAATWSEPEMYLSRATVGSPPDPFATQGQDWHLAGLRPAAIAAGKSPPFTRMVEAAMRHAGAIRIDHAAALRRLFLVPVDMPPSEGAYVDYPQEELLAILARASAACECLVIGEDLGLLPEGLQDDLTHARILSYRILSYERDDEGFKPSEAYPALSLACISTHDHETLAGWWRGADIAAREKFGIVPPEVTKTHAAQRKRERRDLRDRLARSGIETVKRLPPPKSRDETLTPLIVGAHRFIAKTPSRLVAVRLADLTGEKAPTNIPGTTGTYPNWKPKLSVTIEKLPDLPLLQAVCAAMRQERPGRKST